MRDRVNLMRKSVNIPVACRERYVPLDHQHLAPWRRAAVEFSGVSDLVPGYRIVQTQPSRLMLIATTAGRGWAATPAGTVALEPGTLFIGVPGEAVGWGVDSGSWQIVWWYLRPTALWRTLVTPHGTLRPYRPAALLAALQDGVIDRLGAGGGLDQTLGRHHADAVLLHLRELAEATPRISADDGGFTALWEEIAHRLHEPWTVPGMAERLGVSASSLQREAKHRFGRSIHQELIRLRMEHARHVLRRTAYPLQVVAELVGFADPYTFSAAYRRWSGRPPSEERRYGA